MTTTDEPTTRRKFVLLNPDGNNNKVWQVEVYPQPGGQVLMRTIWGRVGQNTQSKDKLVWPNEVDRLVREKTGKGYRELELAKPKLIGSSGATVSAPVSQLVGWIFSQAGEGIREYSSVPVDQLSQRQIAEGRQWLAEAKRLEGSWQRSRSQATLNDLADAVREFYMRIPTKIPGRVDRDSMVYHFHKNLHEYAVQLDRLEAALDTLVVPGGNQYNALGADITWLEPGNATRDKVAEYVTSSAGDHFSPKVQDVFEICIPHERARFEADKQGKNNVRALFHGTNAKNVRHIVKQGFRIPTIANRSTKSGQYAHASGPLNMLMVCNVALGNIFVTPHSNSSMTAPSGYDSVMAEGGKTTQGQYSSTLMKYDELIVYRVEQCTIRFLVTFKRG
jgi:predicted DNA-binding WGR domain protein